MSSTASGPSAPARRTRSFRHLPCYQSFAQRNAQRKNANQELARVATALCATPKRREGGCAVFSSASLSSDAPQGRGYRIMQAVFRAEKRAAQKYEIWLDFFGRVGRLIARNDAMNPMT